MEQRSGGDEQRYRGYTQWCVHGGVQEGRRKTKEKEGEGEKRKRRRWLYLAGALRRSCCLWGEEVYVCVRVYVCVCVCVWDGQAYEFGGGERGKEGES